MVSAGGIEVLAHDLAQVVDAVRLGPHGARNVDGRQHTLVEQEPMGQIEGCGVGIGTVRADDCPWPLIFDTTVMAAPGTSMVMKAPCACRRKPWVVPRAST